MANTYTQDPDFAYITRLTKHGTKFAACGGITNRVLIAERASGGGVNYLGQSEELTGEPLDIVSNGIPSAYYVLTPNGVTVLSAVDEPAITAEIEFSTGSHRWLAYTASARLLAPLPQGGIRLMTTAGVVLADLCGIVSESTYGVLDGTTLYLFDGKRGRLAFITVGASSLVYEGQISAPNCREVLRAVVDGDNLYCLNRHRVVRFDITEALEPTFAEDYGLKSYTYTDLAVVGTDEVWYGYAEIGQAQVGDLFFGPVFSVWDSSNAELHAAAPQMSAWTVNDVVPFVSKDRNAGEILPNPPVITSSLAKTATEAEAWTYAATATGADPITWSATNLPPWATLDPLTGAISGTPDDATDYDIKLTATNAGGSTTKTLKLTVDAAIGDLSAVRVNGRVRAFHRISNLLYMGGDFTQVTDASGAVTRNKVACLDLATGLFTAWNPNVSNNLVFALGSDGDYIYCGGTFTATAVTSRARLFRCDPTTGTIDSWNPNPTSGQVNTITFLGGSIWVGGTFSTISSVSRLGIAVYDSAGTIGSFNFVSSGAQPSRIFAVSGGYYMPVNSSLAGVVGRITVVDSGGNLVTSPMPGGVNVVATDAFMVGTDVFLVGPIQGGPPTAFNAQTNDSHVFKTSSAGLVSSFDLAGTTTAGYSGCKDTSTTDIFIGARYTAPTTGEVLRWDSSTGARVGSFEAVLAGTGIPDVLLRYANALFIGGSFTSIDGDTARANFGAKNVASGALM